jgi:hypothetical protein
MTTHFRALLGTDRLNTVAIGLLNISLALSTYANYDCALREFFALCAEEGLLPLHSTLATMAHYTAWLGLLGTVATGSLQPYFSAVNKYFMDHHLSSSTVRELLADTRRGIEMQEQRLVPSDTRLSLPALVALDILHPAAEIRQTMEGAPASLPLSSLFGLC